MGLVEDLEAEVASLRDELGVAVSSAEQAWRLVGAAARAHRAVVDRLYRLSAGEDPSVPVPGVWLSPGQLWHRLLLADRESRLVLLGDMIEGAQELARLGRVGR